MFAVDDIEDVLGRLHACGVELIGELEQPWASSSRWAGGSAEVVEAAGAVGEQVHQVEGGGLGAAGGGEAAR